MKLTTVTGSPVANQISEAISLSLPGSQVRVTAGQPGHFSIMVRWAEFAGKNRLACQRLVYKAIAPLMSGAAAPVHAVDQLDTGV
jgi:acid stress-induced BolA-like protein IbaG/YrbA